MKRNNRKDCLKMIGESEYNFFRNNELAVYKYIVGYKMSKKEWNLVTNTTKIRSYREWNKEINIKYRKYSVFQLHEFIRYLKSCIDRNDTFQSGFNIFLSAAISAIFSIVFSITLTLNIYEHVLTNFIYIILVAIFIIIFEVMCLGIIMKQLQSDKITECMYKEYIIMIERIIEQKR